MFLKKEEKAQKTLFWPYFLRRMQKDPVLAIFSAPHAEMFLKKGKKKRFQAFRLFWNMLTEKVCVVRRALPPQN